MQYAQCAEDGPIGKILLQLVDRQGECANKIAGTWLMAYWLHLDRFAGQVLSGIDSTRSPAWPITARVTAMETVKNATDASSDRRLFALRMGLRDISREVFDAAAEIFRDDFVWTLPHPDQTDVVKQFLDRLINDGLGESRLWQLEQIVEHYDRPATLASMWLALVDQLVNSFSSERSTAASRDYWMHNAAGKHLASLLLRLISEAKSNVDLHNRILDAWDKMLTSGILGNADLRDLLSEVPGVGIDG